MKEIFQIRAESRYNIRYTSQFTIPPIHSVYNGRESVYFMDPKIWKLVPPAFKQIFFFFMFFITSHLQHKLEVSVPVGF